MTNDEKIEKIQKKLEQLSQKQLDLQKTHQQQFFLYRWLQGPDPDLQSVNDEIARLEKDKDNYFKILQAAASIPPPVLKKDWSKSPFYSHTLRSWNYDYPPDQMGFYVTTLTVIGIVSKAFWRSWNIKKAAEMLEKGGGESEMLSFHRHFSGLNNLELKYQVVWRRFLKLKALAVAGLIVSVFTAFVQLKNKNRFDK
jgi:hypothetical protein